MKIALYARVSTTDKNQDVDMQLHELRNYAEARGWEAVEFVDRGISGAKEKRPALDELLLAARRRKIGAVAVWKLDRLGRSLSHLLQLLGELESLGIVFLSLRDSIDLSTPTGRLMMQMLGAFAEFERELLRERVCAGIANAKRKGKQIGRRPTAQEDIDRVVETFLADMTQSIRQLSVQTEVPRATVHRIIQEYRSKSN